MIQPSETAELAVPSGSTYNLRSAGRRLLLGSGTYATTNFALKAFNFLLLTIFTRYLTPSDYGTISLAEITAATLSIFSDLGLDTALHRLYFHYADDPAMQRKYVSSVVRFGAAGTVAVLGLAFFVGSFLLPRFLPHLAMPFFPYVALAIATSAANQFVDYRLGLYQNEQRPLAFSLMASVSFLLISVATLALVVLFHRGATGMLTGKLLGTAGAMLVAISVSRKWWSGGFEWKFVRESLPIALPIVPHMLMALGLVVADRFILEHYRNLDEVGVYSVAYTFGMAMYLVTASISQAWSPLFFDVARAGPEGLHVLGRLFSGLALLLVGVAIFGSLIAQDVVTHFLDRRYWSAGRLIPWIIAGYLFHALYSILQPSLLQARRIGFLWVVSGVALVANIVLNFLWIPRSGMYGAAYATTAAYVLEAILMFLYAQWVYPLAFSKIRLAVSLTIFCAVLWVTQVHWQNWRLAVFGFSILASLSLILGIGWNELTSLAGSLTKKGSLTAVSIRRPSSEAKP